MSRVRLPAPPAPAPPLVSRQPVAFYALAAVTVAALALGAYTSRRAGVFVEQIYALLLVLAVVAAYLGRSLVRDAGAAAVRASVLDKAFATAQYTLDGQCTTANARFLKMIGQRLSDLRGAPHDVICPSEVRESAEHRELWDALRRGESRSGTYRRLARGGREILVEASYYPVFGAHGRPDHIITFCLDVTDEHARQQALVQAAAEVAQRNIELAEARDRALSATKAKSAFLASMSHEIRTPMNAVLGMADLLRETPLNAEQSEYVGRFSRAATTLLDLINDILDLSKIEASQVEIESAPFDLPELMDQLGEMMAVRAFAKKLELVLFVHPDVPTHVIGDATRLRQILVNLVGNAIKFTDVGEVAIRVEPVAGATQPGLLRFSVADTGIGIPANRQSSIFDSFTQVDSSTTRKYGGTGLGLSIARRLAQLMGGNLTVASVVGQGSTFSVDLALTIASQSAAQQRTLAPITLAGRRILVVDDHENNRVIIQAHLSRLGAEVIEADGGVAALRALDEAARHARPFDALALDFQMPGMNGIELAERIRARSDGAALPLLLCSSEVANASAARLRELGITSCIYKPIGRQRLLAAIGAVLNPPAVATDRPAEPGPAAAPQARPLRLLLVEDVADNRDIIALFLKDQACQIDMAENGAIAVAKCTNGDYDLVLMDVQMPEMDGYEATTAIRRFERDHGRGRTPIVALTADACVEDVDRALTAGCDAHVAKPIRKPTLLTTIATYARSRDRAAA